MRNLRLVSFTLAALAALSAPVQAERIMNLSKFDSRPLLRIQAVGTTFTADSFETDVFIYRGGPVFLMHSMEERDEHHTARGVATPEALAMLNRELAEGRVGQQQGGCGEPAPDYIESYTLTWYSGDKRLRTFVVGGNYQSCPESIRRIMDAVCAFAWQTLESSPQLCAPPTDR